MQKNKISFFKDMTLSVQHLISMYSGAVAVPLLIGSALKLSTTEMTYLISIDIFMCGIATLLQTIMHKYFGIGLPVMMGCAIQCVTPLIMIAQKKGITTVYGSIIVAGILIFLIAGYFSKMQKLFPPIVTGSVICVIGLSLIPIAFEKIGGGNKTASNFGSSQNLLVAAITVLTILLIQKFGKGFVKTISVLIGILVGSVVAGTMGMIDFSPVTNANYFSLPKLFYFGLPTFDLESIVLVFLVMLICLVESTGCYYAIADMNEQKLSNDDLKRGYRAEGIAVVLGGLVNTFPYTTFSQNIGLMQLSGIKDKKIIQYAGWLLVALGLFPKFGALAQLIPEPVLGSAMLFMFSMVSLQGIKIISKCDLSDQNNLLLASLTIGVGIGVGSVQGLFTNLPEFFQMFLNNNVVLASIVAIVLNIIFLRRCENE